MNGTNTTVLSLVPSGKGYGIGLEFKIHTEIMTHLGYHQLKLFYIDGFAIIEADIKY